MDAAGYPTDDELIRIHDWPLNSSLDFTRLLAYVNDLWKYAQDGYWRQHGRTYRISTAGWSGNESIVGALQKNRLFWIMCWQSSRRGGHYVFRIPTIRPAIATSAKPATTPIRRPHYHHRSTNRRPQ